jgi:D-glycero-alpha-D-manno-heptose-7-phosphate kinase
LAPEGGRVIEVSVPVRLCDIGGWTDTWFGTPGKVLNVAVRPGVDVSIRATDGHDPVVLDVEGAGGRYALVPGAPRTARHQLVEAAIDLLPPRAGTAIEIEVRSAVPAGCGAGTSAAVAVALLGGLSAGRAEARSTREIAYLAHRLEVDVLGAESGVQDQLSAAFGGISYIEVEPYPEATVRSMGEWADLDVRLSLVFLGRPHDSSAVHREVIDRLTNDGSSAALAALRSAAVAARDAVVARDLHAFGRAMIDNTDAQRALHPGLIGADARRVFDCATRDHALGWKANGAGGDGGSVTILHAHPEDRERFRDHLARLDPRYRVLPCSISAAGLEVKGAL